ncbi:MAG: Isochorismatase [Bordetella sp. SCN 68-11]|nr:MAG: Isochorismatase [Bordetella sp. SCN 68-11]
MGQQALLVIDLQNDYFPSGKWPLVGIDAAAANAARVIHAARAAGVPVVHVRHEGLSAEAPFFAPGTDGADIHASVLPQGGEAVVTKHYPNAFRGTDLEQTLDARGVEEVTVIHDACATRDLEFDGRTVPAAQVHDAFMSALGFAYASVVATEDYLARA